MTFSKTSLSRPRRVGALIAALAMSTALTAGCAGGGDDDDSVGPPGSSDEEREQDDD